MSPIPPADPKLLLICDYRPREASTVIDHIEAIRRWSRNDVFVLSDVLATCRMSSTSRRSTAWSFTTTS